MTDWIDEQVKKESKNWKCPECTAKLVIKPDMGTGIKWCLICDTSWFIVRCRRPKKVKNK